MNKQILCFGDSNTYGLRPDGKGRYSWGVRWTSLVQKQVASLGYRIIEEGLCGRTTIFEDAYRPGRKGDALLPAILESHAPLDTVVLMLGTNDCKTAYGADAAAIGGGIRTLLEQIRRITPDSKILLLSPIYLGKEVWKKQYDPEFCLHSVQVSKDLEAEYEKVAKQYGAFFMRAADYARCSVTDQEHLDEIGHARLAQAITDKLLNEVLPEEEYDRRMRREHRGYDIIATKIFYHGGRICIGE